ncbi:MULTISPECIES: hypothetical protein [Pseudoalteromonas]|nr:hypothetical protein [Pseudoalteromonas piratica]
MKKITKMIALTAISMGFSVAAAASHYCIKCDDIGCQRITCPPSAEK